MVCFWSFDGENAPERTLIFLTSSDRIVKREKAAHNCLSQLLGKQVGVITLAYNHTYSTHQHENGRNKLLALEKIFGTHS